MIKRTPMFFLMLFMLTTIYGCNLNSDEKKDSIKNDVSTPTEDQAPDSTPTPDFEPLLSIDMVQVGVYGTTYTIPIGADDSGTAEVEGGYFMAKTQTTYELWYEVRTWAEDNNFRFQNKGREGNRGTVGHPPTENAQEPVTMVSWRDVIVWLNALSEMNGFEPVYRDKHDNIIRDSRDSNGAVVDASIQTNNNGYRLPTSHEWEMAARWKNNDEEPYGYRYVNGLIWTAGNYASGAKGPAFIPTNEEATQAVSWYADNSDTGNGRKTQPVAQLLPNHLGIYDMSGNVWEWTFTPSDTNDTHRVIRGGSWTMDVTQMQVGTFSATNTTNLLNFSGFRIVKNP